MVTSIMNKTLQLQALDDIMCKIDNLCKYHKFASLKIINNFNMIPRNGESNEFMEEQMDGQNTIVLESSHNENKAHNITIIDERPVDTAELHTNSIQTRDFNNDMCEKPWNINDILGREFPIDSFEWHMEKTISTVVYSEGVPKLITKDDTCMIKKQLEFWAFARFGVRIRVQINGTKFHCGRLIAYFKPLTWNDDQEENYSSITCYPHCFLDASTSNSGVIEIPFTHLLSHFSQVSKTLLNDSTNALGQLIIRPYNQLRAAEKASPVIYGEIYVSLINPSLHLPISKVTAFSYGNGYLQGAEAFAMKLLEGFLKAGLKSVTGGLVVGGVDLLLSQIGVYDKPIDPTDGDRIINKTISSLCHGVGLDKSVRLALVPDSVTLTPPDQLGSSDGDFNISTMCKIPCLVKTVSWSTEIKGQTLLYSFTLTPTYISDQFYSLSGNGKLTNYSPTMMAYNARAFAYWRGPLKVKIQIVDTPFHSGRLALVHDAHGTTLVNLKDFTSNRSHNIIVMDVQEKKEIEIDIPFMAVKPWLRCGRFRSDQNMDYKAYSSDYLDTCSMGIFRIFVLNSLVRPDNVTPVIDINIFFYASDGFELAVPCPLTPLNVRGDNSKLQYANLPRYPYCKDSASNYVVHHDLIDNLYWQGRRLSDYNRLVAGNQWYNATSNGNHPDTIVWLEQLRKFSRWMIDNATTAEKKYIASLANYKPPAFMVEQSLEEYTTNRDSSQPSVCTTTCKKYKSAAPNTISENSMNLQTVLRRYYPLLSTGIVENFVDFTLVAIPVSPSFVPDDDETSFITQFNRRYDVNTLSWYSRLFTFHRGSLRYKILVSASNSDVYIWHNPVDVSSYKIYAGFSHEDVLNQTCFATDAGVTQVQQGFEVEVPFFSGFNQLVHSHISSKNDLRCRNGTLFIAVRNPKESFSLSVFVASGEDFRMNVMRSPPVLHEPWVMAYTDGEVSSDLIKYPEFNNNLEHNSITFQKPSGFVFNGKAGGHFTNCKPPDAPMVEQMFESYNPLSNINNKVDSAIDTVNYFKQSYTDDVLPELHNVSSFVSELKDVTVPFIMENFNNLAERFVKSADKVDTLVPQVDQVFDKVQALSVNAAYAAERIGTFSEQATSTVEYIGDLSDTMGIFFKMINYTGLWLNIVNLYNKFSFMNLMQVCINASCIFGSTIIKVGKFIYEQIVATYEGFRPNAADGAEETSPPMLEESLSDIIADNMENLNVTLAALATIVYCTLFGDLPTWSLIKTFLKTQIEGVEQGASDFMRKMHFTNSGFRAMGQAFEYFKEKIEQMIDYFMGKECRSVLLEKQFKEKAKQVEEWIDKIAELDDEDFFQDALSNVDRHNEYYRLVDQGNEFTKWLMNEGVSKNVSSVIRDANKRLMDMIKKIKNIRPGDGYRYSPFVVCLHGPSSTGKSDMMHKITDLMRENLQIPYYNSVYAMPVSDKYLSGYEGQPIVEWDDHLQMRDQDALVGQFINWCSNTDTRVNMADLEHKGSQFSSKAFVMTTNAAYANIHTIRELEAYQRRRNIVVGVDFAPGWNKERMYTAPYDPTYSHCVFSIREAWGAGNVIVDNMNWQQVIAYIDEQHGRWHAKQLNMMEQYFNTRPSLRIPNGVIIEEGEGEEQAYVVKFINKNATAEERLDFEIFEEEFNFVDISEKKKYFDKFKSLCTTIFKESKNYWILIKKKIALGFNKIFDTVKNFYKQYPTFCKGMAALTAFIGAGFALNGIMRLFQDNNLFEESAGDYTGGIRVPSRNIVHAESGSYCSDIKSQATPKISVEGTTSFNNIMNMPVKEHIHVNPMQSQGTDDPDAINLARRKVYHHVYQIGWNLPHCIMLMQGIMIEGKIIMAPHHFFRRAVNGDRFFFIRGGNKITVEYDSQRMVRIGDKDLVLYFMGAQVDSCKRITDCFIHEKLLSIVAKKVPAILVGVTPDGVMIEKNCTAQGEIKMNYHGPEDNAPVYTQYGWKYNINTEKGECGSALIACTKLLPPPSKIIGIHTAGYANKSGGFSVLITKEQVEMALKVLSDRFGSQVIGCTLPVQVTQTQEAFEQCKIVPIGDFSYYGAMNQKFCPSQPTKTNLIKTPFFEELYPITKKPAALIPINGISPLCKALGKYGKSTIPFPIKHIKAVRNSIFNDLVKLNSSLKAEPTTLEIAVFGVPQLKYCDRMNMNSSPGWPYQCLRKGEKGKAYLFDLENKVITDTLLLRNIEERENLAIEGKRFPSIWRDCLKDELRTLEKVENGKTRLFTIGPVDFTILTRKYFLAFEQAFYDGHNNFFSAVGINAESFEWTQAYNRLRSFGTDCIAGDFGSFDGTLMSDLIYETGELISDWYEAKGEKCSYARTVRRVLIDEMIHTFQLVNNCVYKTHMGNPSGNPLTVIINTIVNAFYMRLAWMSIMSDKCPAKATMDAYTNNVIEEMYGDDNRLVVKRPVLKFYNQITISECLSQHGIEYTDEGKNKVFKASKHLDETSFLKRSYRWDKEVGKHIALPVMDIETLTNLTNWTRNNIDLEEQLQANQRAILGFAFFHGREIFNEFNQGFSQKMIEYDMTPISLTYDELLDIFMDDIQNNSSNYSKAFGTLTFTEQEN